MKSGGFSLLQEGASLLQSGEVEAWGREVERRPVRSTEHPDALSSD